jgi:hypothetical protein
LINIGSSCARQNHSFYLRHCYLQNDLAEGRLEIGGERLELARPMMTGGAGFDSNEARRKLLKERQDVTTLQLTPDYHLAFNVNSVGLKNRFDDVETDSRGRLHDWLLRIVGASTAPTSTASPLRASRIVYEYFNWERVIDYVAAVILVVLVRLDQAARVLGAGQQRVLPRFFRCKPIEFPTSPRMPSHRV